MSTCIEPRRGDILVEKRNNVQECPSETALAGRATPMEMIKEIQPGSKKIIKKKF